MPKATGWHNIECSGGSRYHIYAHQTNQEEQMKLTNKGGNFKLHPETDGTIKAVVVDITPLKKRVTQYGEKEEFRLVFETEVVDEEKGHRFCIWSRGYTCSLDEKAAIRKDLKKMMGRDLTALELKEFDLETIIGLGVKLIVQHESKDDKNYANISFIAPDKTDPLKPSGKYKRIKDRDDAPAAAEDKPAASLPQAESNGWMNVVVHIGKFAGEKLGDVDEAGVTALIENWLPKAKAGGKAEDHSLAKALDELAAILAAEDICY